MSLRLSTVSDFKPRFRRPGFTPAELLVVIAIIGTPALRSRSRLSRAMKSVTISN